MENNISFANKNSSKLFLSKIIFPINLTKIIITSFSPFASCSTPWTGPAVANDENMTVKNARIPVSLFIIKLEV